MEKIPGVIIDFSNREQTEQELAKEIERANVICLVYAMDDDISKEKLKTYWLPKIHEVHDSSLLSPSNSCSTLEPNSEASSNTVKTKQPILIVANKNDSDNRNNLLNDPQISQLIAAYSQIETCIQCSAKNLKNVPEVFYYAQKSVLYPTSPIYDLENKKLTSQCVKCLTRIFKLCDADNDGLLNDKELKQFQLKCFGVHLNVSSLQEVKALLNNNNEINDKLINNEVTLNGFLYLNTLFVIKGRHETLWIVLKKFGYDRNLAMSREYTSIR